MPSSALSSSALSSSSSFFFFFFSLLLLVRFYHRTRNRHMRRVLINRQRLREVLWGATAAVTVVLAIIGYREARWRWRDAERQRINLQNILLPRWWAFSLADKQQPNRHSEDAVAELVNAPWMGTWAVPELTPPVHGQDGVLTSPAWVMLHIFSTPTVKGAEWRNFLRRVSPLLKVPRDYRHLIEVKFVIGYPEDDESSPWAPRRNLDREQKLHGDLVLLEGLLAGENMNHGKTIAWVQHLGRSGREAQWVIKTDEDTLVLMPNLLEWLEAQNPAQPTYFGTSLTRWQGYVHYFEGMMYGLSWGVVKTIAAAELPLKVITAEWDEDARTGQLMFSLPTAPRADLASLPSDHTGCALNFSGPNPVLYDINPLRVPANPDPRTGLNRHDLLWRVGDYGKWWVSRAASAIAWHRLKDESNYLKAYEEAETARRWHKFMWHPPASMHHLRDPKVTR